MAIDAVLAKLHIRDDDGQVTTLSLQDQGDRLTIGRDFDNTVHLPDITVSRFHARLTRAEQGKQYLLEDLSSYNGVLLNGEKVEGPTAIGVGDRFVVGSFMFWFESADGRGCFDCPTVRIESPFGGEME